MEIKNLLVETVWAFYQWLDEGMDCMLDQTKMDQTVSMSAQLNYISVKTICKK